MNDEQEKEVVTEEIGKIKEEEAPIEEEIETPEETKEEDKPKEEKPQPKEKEEDLVIETRQKREEKIEFDDDIDPGDVETISKVVEKQVAGIKRSYQETQDRMEINSFLKESPQFTKYEDKILKYMQHPAYSQIPIKNIAHMLAADELMKMGAAKEREAQARADATKGGGNAVRKQSGGSTDWGSASKDEFEAQRKRILGQF